MSSRHDNYSEDESDDNSGYSDSDAEVNENSVEYEHEQDRGVNAQEDNALGSLSMRKKRKGSNRRPGSSDADDSNLNLKHKNAPAVMPSNRPVKRLRVDANNSTKEYRDPRFSNVSGQLNNDKFLQAYDFLDGYQEDEVQKLSKAMKKTKSPARKEAIKEAFVSNKQQLTERRRSQKLKERMQAVKREERDKVAEGKGAFFLKRSAKKAIAVEERFNELKRDGKLQKFMAKKRQRNANKDFHKMPARRDDDENY